jgi:hypothetical protein
VVVVVKNMGEILSDDNDSGNGSDILTDRLGRDMKVE